MAAASPAIDVTKRAALGFFAGVRALFGGLWFVVSTPSVWGWALVPIVIATALFGALGTGGVLAGSALAARIMGDAASTWSTVGLWALRILFWALGILIAFVVAMSLAQPASGFALEALARRQEQRLGGRTWPDQPFVASTLRSLRVSLVGLAVGLPILAVLAAITFLFPPAGVVTVPLKFVVAGLTAAYDFLDYPFSVRGQGVSARAAFMRENASAVLGFGLAAAALLLVPGMALALLPVGVAGATRLVVKGDARPQETFASGGPLRR